MLSCADVDEVDKPPSAGHNTEMDSDVDPLKVQDKEAISDTVDSEANVLNEIKDIGTCKKDCNTDLEQKVENSNVIDETDFQDKKDIEANTDIKDNLDDKSEEIIETGTNSTWMLWVRYFLDPFLEEFKDGIYSRSNKNSSDNNVSETVFNNSNLSNIHVINETVPDFLNITDSDQNSTDASKKTKFQCTGKNVTDNSNVTVQIVTSSKLLQLLSFEKNETENVTDCLVVMFYAPWCHFCAKMAPYYNALSRAFPQLDFVAVDTAQFSK